MITGPEGELQFIINEEKQIIGIHPVAPSDWPGGQEAFENAMMVTLAQDLNGGIQNLYSKYFFTEDDMRRKGLIE